MNILFATTLIPSGRGTGGEVISGAIIDAIEGLVRRVVITGFLRPGDEPAPGHESIVVERRPIETLQSGLRAAGWLARSMFMGMPYTATKFYSPRYGKLVRSLVASERIDTVVIDHTQMLWLVAWLPRNIRVVVVMHNAESELYAREALRPRSRIARFIYRREAKRLRAVEAQMAARADRIWALSEADAGSIRRLGGAAAVSVLPVTPEWRRDRAYREPSFDIGLIASWSWQPNADGLRWFMDEVRPRLPLDTTIHIAGSGAEWVGAYPGIQRHGFVDDAIAFLRRARVIAVPTRYGGGVETKMLASISAGRPIIATSASVRGLTGLPRTVSIADDAAAFADRIAAQLRGDAETAETEAAAWYAARRGEFLTHLGREIALLRPGVENLTAPEPHDFAEPAHAAV